MSLRHLALSFVIFLTCGNILNRENSYAMQEEELFDNERRAMVETQIIPRGVADEGVLKAMRKVKRHLFVPAEETRYAYEDHAMPIGCRQTISQPYIVALMTELAGIKAASRVLEIGTGSGYQAAILAEIAQQVFTIEIIKELAEEARERLQKLGYKNIEIRHGDGYEGWPEHAPYDAILVTAAAPEIPQKLVEELKAGGRLVIPLGDIFQELYVITKNEDGTTKKEHIIPVRFVPMVHGKKQNKD